MMIQEEILSNSLSGTADTAGAGKQISVLLVEDDRSLRRYLQIVLERAGYRVLSAGDGLEAMRVALNSAVDLVITDAMMPHFNGYQLCRFFRSSAQLSQIPLVLLSALERSEENEEPAQVDAFIPKPVSPEKLLQCVGTLLLAGD